MNFRKEWLDQLSLIGWLGWESKAEEFETSGDSLQAFLYSNGPALGAFGLLAIVLLIVGFLPRKKATE